MRECECVYEERLCAPVIRPLRTRARHGAVGGGRCQIVGCVTLDSGC
jgi:hypothetical protein